jgi:hypothetical protein
MSEDRLPEFVEYVSKCVAPSAPIFKFCPDVKLTRKLDQLNRKIRDIFELSNDDPLWTNENFWNTEWPRLIDREAELRETLCNSEIKARADHEAKVTKHVKATRAQTNIKEKFNDFVRENKKLK